MRSERTCGNSTSASSGPFGRCSPKSSAKTASSANALTRTTERLLLILDTNVWILAFISNESKQAALKDSIEAGEERTAVSAYIYGEAIENFRGLRGLSRTDEDRAINNFTRFITGSPHVEAPTQADVERLDLDEVRRQGAHITLGRVLNIQAKDAPIVALAVEHAAEIEACGSDEQVTVCTSDESFGNLDPEEFGLNVEMKYIPYAKEE